MKKIAEKNEKPYYIPLLENEQILNKDFHAKLNSLNKNKGVKSLLNAKTSTTTKTISLLNKNSKRNSQVSMINEQEITTDD